MQNFSPKKIVYVYPKKSSFVLKDISLLETTHQVRVFGFDPLKKIYTPLLFIQQLFLIVVPAIKADIIICQFAGYHSFLPLLFARIFRKPSIIVTGGTDCVSFPSIGYGNFNRTLLGFFTKRSFRLASFLAPVHESLMQYTYSYQPNDPANQGVLSYMPDLKTPYRVIYNGYDARFWKPVKPKIKNRFVTVAHIAKKTTWYLKGMDLIVSVAENFPDCEFLILGVHSSFSLPSIPANVKILGPVANASLPEIYSEAEFYFQLSISEGFPNALCEAMLCGCVPIGSAVGAIPDIIGDAGFVLKQRSVEFLKPVIQSALQSNRELLSAKARQRIAENFTEEKRLHALLGLIEKLTNS
jgi:glycosyltransferase involved in cell wall biosynthesis